ncbi:MAG TPA: RNA 2',3'-cyclic phosphodiesterase [Pirellulales bacterium]
MLRYFVALPLPAEAGQRVVEILPEASPTLRPNRRDELHVTLHFIGEVEPGQDAALRQALSSVRGNAFTLNLRGVGRFPEDGPPSVLWAGVERNPTLFALRYLIGSALSEAIGFQPEERPYVPHVTLGRIAPRAWSPAVADYLETHRGFHVPHVPVDRFVLYSSGHDPSGDKYRQEAVYPLAPAT